MLEPLEVPLDHIHPNPFQARRAIRPEHVERLAASIESLGLQQPPQARPKPGMPGHYELVFGHTRFAAFRLLHQRQPDDSRWVRMPLFQVALDDRGMFEAGMSENLDREDLTCIDQAQALKTYIERFNATQRECGRLFGLTQGAVSNLLRLLRLPPEVIEIVQRGVIAERSARLLVMLEPDEAIRIARGAARRPEEARSDYVARSAREARARMRYQAGQKKAAGDDDLLRISGARGRRLVTAERSSLAPGACPHCWRVPKRYAREGMEWLCGECGRPVRVSVTLG